MPTYYKYILFTSLTLFTSCITVKPLRFEKAINLEVNKTGDPLYINFDLTGHNPNNWSFKLTELQTKITIDGHSFIDLHTDTVMRLKKDADFSIPVRIQATRDDLMKIISSGLSVILNGDKIPFDIQGDFVLKKFLFRKKFSFQLNDKINPEKLN
jgi:hypothetical protein